MSSISSKPSYRSEDLISDWICEINESSDAKESLALAKTEAVFDDFLLSDSYDLLKQCSFFISYSLSSAFVDENWNEVVTLLSNSSFKL